MSSEDVGSEEMGAEEIGAEEVDAEEAVIASRRDDAGAGVIVDLL